MNIEGGPSGYVENLRRPEAQIEGEVVQSFSEIDLDQAQAMPLHHMTWPAACLTFSVVGHYVKPGRFGQTDDIQLYGAEFEYQGKNGQRERSNLSLVTSEKKPVFFTGTRNGFYAHDPLMVGRDLPFYVVGLAVPELERESAAVSAIWHELGHILLCHMNVDIQLLKAVVSKATRDLPAVAKAIEYGLGLAWAWPSGLPLPEAVDRQTLSKAMKESPRVDKAVRLFHERNAWAAGANLVRSKGYPTGFRNALSYFDYARLNLTSYARYFQEEKFVRGWRGI